MFAQLIEIIRSIIASILVLFMGVAGFGSPQSAEATAYSLLTSQACLGGAAESKDDCAVEFAIVDGVDAGVPAEWMAETPGLLRVRESSQGLSMSVGVPPCVNGVRCRLRRTG
jgi:hypothetical protein